MTAAEITSLPRTSGNPDPGATSTMLRLAPPGSLPPWAVVLVALVMGGGGSVATFMTTRADSEARIAKLEDALVEQGDALDKQGDRVDAIEDEAERRDRAISDLSRNLAWVLGATLEIHKGVESIAKAQGVEVDMDIDPLLPGSMVVLPPP